MHINPKAFIITYTLPNAFMIDAYLCTSQRILPQPYHIPLERIEMDALTSITFFISICNFTSPIYLHKNIFVPVDVLRQQRRPSILAVLHYKQKRKKILVPSFIRRRQTEIKESSMVVQSKLGYWGVGPGAFITTYLLKPYNLVYVVSAFEDKWWQRENHNAR